MGGDLIGFINKIIGPRHKLIKRIPGYHYAPNIYGASFNKLIDPRSDKLFFEAATKAIKDRTTSLYYDRLYTFYQLVPKAPISSFVEAGVYKGGSAYFIASIAKKFHKDPKVFAVDTFEGFVKEDNPDGHNKVGVFGDVSYEKVKNYLSEFPFVKVIKGRIQEVAPAEKFGFVHLDMDIYEPTIWSLNYFGKNLASGGAIVVDDYNTVSCPGIKKAIDEFLKENNNFLNIDLMNGQALLIKF